MPTLKASGLQFEDEKPQQRVWYEKSKEVTVQDQEQAATEHGIVYFKQDGQTSVKNEPVDFPKAKAEMESLGCGEDNHFIGFNNLKTHELLQFLRFEPDLWYADVPIAYGRGWDRYVWGCRADLNAVLNTAELFINEDPWFDSLPFTMRRINKDVLHTMPTK